MFENTLVDMREHGVLVDQDVRRVELRIPDYLLVEKSKEELAQFNAAVEFVVQRAHEFGLSVATHRDSLTFTTVIVFGLSNAHP